VFVRVMFSGVIADSAVSVILGRDAGDDLFGAYVGNVEFVGIVEWARVHRGGVGTGVGRFP